MKLAVILVRSRIKLAERIKRTLQELGLNRPNSCIIVEDKPEIKGMLEKIKHVATWGQIDEATQDLLKTRGQGPVYRLNPPRKGYGKRGVKMAFSLGGALGDRKEKICDLIKRMI